MSACAPTTLDEAVASAVLAALPDTVSVERVTRTPDTSGGSTEAYASVPALAAVPCRVMPMGTMGETILADRLGIVDPYVISVPYGTDIRVTDELVALGQRFHVQAVPQVNSMALVTRILATVVTP